ncbi:glycosyltransferase [Peribacillus muralis]|uniref:glycosyltransferase n=1 Tax=Peribacillus muralis TaxID=264697 RepID=UPI003D020BE8
MENIFLVWTKYQARVETLSEEFKRKLGDTLIVYRPNPAAHKVKKIFYYLKYFINDLQLLVEKKPKRIFVQTPPSHSLLAPIIYKKIINKEALIICDLHNAMTREPWLKRLGTQRLLSDCDLIICHNEVVYSNILNNKLFKIFNYNNLVILEDKTPKLKKNFHQDNHKKQTNEPVVFFPASFNNDEPINEVIKAAELLPNYKIIMTGNSSKLKRNFNIEIENLPSNVLITGWITTEEYKRTLNECDILLGLTIFNDIQMSVSNEGLGAEKVMVLSETETLRLIYKDGAQYCENNASSIAENIQIAYKNSDELKRKVSSVKIIKEDRFENQIRILLEKI